MNNLNETHRPKLKFELRITVSKSTQPDLFDIILDAGRYYGGKRILELAILGLSVRNGKAIAQLPNFQVTELPSSNMSSPLAAIQVGSSIPTKREKEVSAKSDNHIENMFNLFNDD